MELLAKGTLWKPQTIPTVAKATACSPQTDGKALYNSWNTEKLSWFLSRPFSHTNIHVTGSCSVLYQVRNVNTNTATNPWIYNGNLPARYTSAQILQQI